MSKFFKSKRGIVLLATMIAAVVAAVGGFAYFSSTGSGSGNATVGSSSHIVITNDTVGNLYPGGADLTVPVHLQNPGGGNEYVADVSGTVADNGLCQGAWFQVDTINYDLTVTHGTTANTSTHVRMLDSGTNQDECQGKTLTINWTSN